MTEGSAKNVAKRLTAGIVTIILLMAALSVTTFVLVATTFTTEGKFAYSAGNVKINLNDGKAVISDYSGSFAPGKRIERNFTIENLSSCDVWYKFYFANVSDAFDESVSVEIKDGAATLVKGKMVQLTEENTEAVETSLAAGEKKTLTIVFVFDETAGGNKPNGRLLQFDFSVKAVQVKNNPDKKFD